MVGDEDTERQTRATVEAAGACFDNRDYSGLDQLVAEDMVNHAAGPQGREGWKQVWRAIVACFPDAVSETKSILVDGDRAAVHMSIRDDLGLLRQLTPDR